MLFNFQGSNFPRTSVLGAVLLADSLYIIPLVFTLVKWFFKVFLSFFNFFYFIFPLTSVKTIFKSPFGRPRYITTFVPVCQVLLGIFLKYFFEMQKGN